MCNFLSFFLFFYFYFFFPFYQKSSYLLFWQVCLSCVTNMCSWNTLCTRCWRAGRWSFLHTAPQKSKSILRFALVFYTHTVYYVYYYVCMSFLSLTEIEKDFTLHLGQSRVRSHPCFSFWIFLDLFFCYFSFPGKFTLNINTNITLT